LLHNLVNKHISVFSHKGELNFFFDKQLLSQKDKNADIPSVYVFTFSCIVLKPQSS